MAAPSPSNARVTSDGKVAQLDGRASAAEVVTEQDVQEPAKLSRLLVRLLTDVAALKRRFAPRRFDFEDVPVLAAGGTVQLQHNFGGRVRWWVVDCTSSTKAWLNAATTADTLVVNLTGTSDGTATIRVESAG